MDAPRKSASMWAELRPCSEFMRVFCRGIERVILIRESWVEVVTSTRPGDSISMRSLYDGCATLVCINIGGTSAMQRVRECFVCGICGKTPRLLPNWVTRGPTRAPTW